MLSRPAGRAATSLLIPHGKQSLLLLNSHGAASVRKRFHYTVVCCTMCVCVCARMSQALCIANYVVFVIAIANGFVLDFYFHCAKKKLLQCRDQRNTFIVHLKLAVWPTHPRHLHHSNACARISIRNLVNTPCHSVWSARRYVNFFLYNFTQS